MAAARCNRRSHTKACRRAVVLGKFFVCNAHATRVSRVAKVNASY